jgi:hypothetical protein
VPVRRSSIQLLGEAQRGTPASPQSLLADGDTRTLLVKEEKSIASIMRASSRLDEERSTDMNRTLNRSASIARELSSDKSGGDAVRVRRSSSTARKRSGGGGGDDDWVGLVEFHEDVK